jgi:hypothetical protein
MRLAFRTNPSRARIPHSSYHPDCFMEKTGFEKMIKSLNFARRLNGKLISQLFKVLGILLEELIARFGYGWEIKVARDICSMLDQQDEACYGDDQEIEACYQTMDGTKKVKLEENENE